MTDPSKIAAGLSEVYKRAVLEMSEQLSWGPDWFALWREHPELVDAVETRPQCISYRLTPSGLEVRKHLEEQSK